MTEIMVVVGARPNFVKVAPVLHALGVYDEVRVRVLNTGQHYDRALATSFLEVLRFPAPDHELKVGSGSHAQQTAAVLVGVERVLCDVRPDAIIVAGDVNSTLAAALAAAKVGIPVVHIEAGLRSRDRAMPEEVNRVLTDQIGELLLCTSADAVENLHHEGIPGERIVLVGNTMIDSLLALEGEAAKRDLVTFGLSARGYALVTLHRPSLVDDPKGLAGVIEVLEELAGELPVLFPAHPRTRAKLERRANGRIRVTDPLDYVDFLALERQARVVITDSGGVQEETSVLGVPCLTYRTTTERPITVEQGTNELVGVAPERLRTALRGVLRGGTVNERPTIPLWDGQAGARSAAAIMRWLAER